MFSSGFGGHPVLHHYNYMMVRRQQEELLRQAEYERLIRAAKRKQRQNWLGTHLVHWGRKLERFGNVGETRPAPSASPHH